MSAEHQNGHEQQLRRLWEQSGGDDLLKGRNFQDIYDAIPNRQEVTNIGNRLVACMDEGLNGVRRSFGIRTAGADILNPNQDELAGEAEGYVSHDGCGAAALYCKENGIQTDNPDAVGAAEAKKRTEGLGTVYEHVTADDMTRPEFHNARVFYYTDVKFDPKRVEGLPPGLVHTTQYFDNREYCQEQVRIGTEIVLGPHGFGDLFTENSPFYLVAVADTEPAEDQLVQELKEVAKGNYRLKVDSILVETSL